MDQRSLIHGLESAATSGRYRSMAFYARTLASNDPSNLDAVGLHLKNLIASGSLRQATDICSALDHKIYENVHTATAYFDLLALSERYGELFQHVWLSFINAALREAYVYMESALTVLESQVTAKMIEAKAAMSCQLEIDLLDRILLSFSSETEQPLLLEASSNGASQVFLEITELTRHICQGAHPTGIQRCICEIVHALDALGERANVFFFRPMESCAVSMRVEKFLQVLNSNNGVDILRDIISGEQTSVTTYEVRNMEVSTADVVVLIDVFWTHPERKVAFLDGCPCTKILYVHDLIPMILDNEPAPNKIFSPSLLAIATRVDGILCNSNYTAGHVRRFLELEGVGSKQCGVAQLASEIPTNFSVFTASRNEDFRSHLIASEMSGKKFILTVSSLSERKRIVELAEAFIDASAGVAEEWYLVIVGGDPGNNPGLTERLRRLCGASNGKILWLKGASDRQLMRLYHSCQFAAYTSIFEGWGLPIGEALAYGKPVLAHHVSSIPEVGGELVYYCKPDRKSLSAALQELMSDEGSLDRLAKNISRADLRSWRDVAKQFTAEGIKELFVDQLLNTR